MRFYVTAILLLLAIPVQAQQTGHVRFNGAGVYTTPFHTLEPEYRLSKGAIVHVVGEVEGFYTVRTQGLLDNVTGFMRKEDIEIRLQAAPASQVRSVPKSPGMATVLAVFITGAGHLYADETLVGAGLLGVGIAAPTIGYLATAKSISAQCGSRPFDAVSCDQQASYAPLYVGLGIGLAAHLFGIIDASSAVGRYNERYGLALRPADDGPGLALTVAL